MTDQIVNRVEKSGIVDVNLSDYYPEGERVVYDIKDDLYEGLLLKEKDFREHINNTDWSEYKDKFVAITCTADAIVPTWAYMLLTSKIEPHAKMTIWGDLETLETILFRSELKQLNLDEFKGKPVVIKGCGEHPVPTSAFVEFTNLIRPLAKSIMYGEPCSTVPIYKQKA